MSRSIIRRKRKHPQDTIKSICKNCNHDKARKFENSFMIIISCKKCFAADVKYKQ